MEVPIRKAWQRRGKQDLTIVAPSMSLSHRSSKLKVGEGSVGC